MAIDDNATYGLTGAQVKDLADKVKVAQSTFHDITDADKNWNMVTHTTENPDCVALWLLPPGLYRFVNVGFVENTTTSAARANGWALIVWGTSSSTDRAAYYCGWGEFDKIYFSKYKSDGTVVTGPLRFSTQAV